MRLPLTRWMSEMAILATVHRRQGQDVAVHRQVGRQHPDQPDHEDRWQVRSDSADGTHDADGTGDLGVGDVRDEVPQAAQDERRRVDRAADAVAMASSGSRVTSSRVKANEVMPSAPRPSLGTASVTVLSSTVPSGCRMVSTTGCRHGLGGRRVARPPGRRSRRSEAPAIHGQDVLAALVADRLAVIGRVDLPARDEADALGR